MIPPALHEPFDESELGQEANASSAEDALAVKAATVSEETRVAGSRDDQALDFSPGRHRLVGSSGIVATLNQTFLTHDFVFSDPSLNNLLPTEPSVYCVLARMRLAGLEPEVQENEVDFQEAEQGALQAGGVAQISPFAEPACLLDEAMWKLGLALDRKSKFRRSLRPQRLGRKFGNLIRSGLTEASRLASVWPQPGQEAIRSETAGDKLLARAEAVTEDDAVALSQVDQVQLDEFKQAFTSWWHSAESVRQWLQVIQRPDIASIKQDRRR